MEWNTPYTISVAIVLAGVVVGVFARWRNGYTKETIDSQKELIDVQGKKIDVLEQEMAEQAKEISHLKGELKTYKEMPLADISNTLKQVSESQLETVKILKSRKAFIVNGKNK